MANYSRTYFLLLVVLFPALLLAAGGGERGEGEPGSGSRSPPDIRALDLAIDDARLERETSLVTKLKEMRERHMEEMGNLMTRAEAKEQMQKIEDLSEQLAGSTGKERSDLHKKLHEAISLLEDEKFVSMGMGEADRNVHSQLLRDKHKVVIQLVDQDELHLLSKEEHEELLEQFEAIEIKIVMHMKDYFLAQAKRDL
jgi:hypothetical protein